MCNHDLGDSLSHLDEKATAERIAQICAARDLGTAELAERLGVTYQCVYGWLRGYRLPSLDNLVLLAQILHINISDLLVTTEEKDNEQ